MQTALESDRYHRTVLNLTQSYHYQQAITCCKRSIGLGKLPERTLAILYYNWGYCCYRQGKYQEAISKYKRVLGLDPGSAETYNAWGTCLSNMKRYDEAIEKLQEAVKLGPTSPFAFLNWILALLLQDKEEEAVVLVKEKFEKTNYRELDVCRGRYRSEILQIEARISFVAEEASEMRLLVERLDRCKLLIQFIDKVKFGGSREI